VPKAKLGPKSVLYALTNMFSITSRLNCPAPPQAPLYILLHLDSVGRQQAKKGQKVTTGAKGKQCCSMRRPQKEQQERDEGIKCSQMQSNQNPTPAINNK